MAFPKKPSIAERMARSGEEEARRLRKIRMRVAVWLGVLAAILVPLFYFGLKSG